MRRVTVKVCAVAAIVMGSWMTAVGTAHADCQGTTGSEGCGPGWHWQWQGYKGQGCYPC
jgi:hypothetical protein